jgi:hypothetical protein
MAFVAWALLVAGVGSLASALPSSTSAFAKQLWVHEFAEFGNQRVFCVCTQRLSTPVVVVCTRFNAFDKLGFQVALTDDVDGHQEPVIIVLDLMSGQMIERTQLPAAVSQIGISATDDGTVAIYGANSTGLCG